jgi:hypothetical protein
MKRSLKTIVGIFAVCLSLGIWSVASERYYVGIKRPEGILTVEDYFLRFGEPSFVRMVERDGQSYYEFNGFVDPPWWCLAVPSGPPAYIFDERGKFIEWCADPGDGAPYRRRWPLRSTDEVNVASVKRKFDL